MMVTKEQMINYLQTHDLGFGFKELHDIVIDKDNCSFCGACIALCPRIGKNETKPKLLEYDPECSTCFKYCARTFFPLEVFEKEIFNNEVLINPFIGHFIKSTVARSTNDSVLKVAQNGGVVSTILIHALNTGLIDGVLVTGKDEKWEPKPFIARTPEEILANAGSRYTIAPSLITYIDAIQKFKLKKLAFVGTPCQIQVVRKLQLHSPISEEFGKFKLIIGLYCSSNYSQDLMNKFVQQELRIPLSNVKKIDISRGKFLVYTNDGNVKSIPIRDTKEYSWPSCQHCRDYTAEYADISVGSVGAPEDDWNSVIIRTEVGKNVFEDAVSDGKINVADNIDISKIEKECLRKKSQLTKVDEKVLSAMKLLNDSDFEIKTYTSLISLGLADASMLSRVMKVEEGEVQNALDSLKKREWILETNGIHRSVNPSKVIQDEMNRFKKKFEEKIKRIKSEALDDLETLYMQNNMMYVKHKDLTDTISENKE